MRTSERLGYSLFFLFRKKTVCVETVSGLASVVYVRPAERGASPGANSVVSHRSAAVPPPHGSYDFGFQGISGAGPVPVGLLVLNNAYQQVRS